MKRGSALLFPVFVLLAAALALPGSAPAAESLGPISQVSNAGPAGDVQWRATYSDIAASDRYEGSNLVVWLQDNIADTTTAAVFGRMYDPITGAPRTDPFQISESGPHNATTDKFNPPAVTFNSTANEFLVSWNDDTDTNVYVRRVSASGTPLGADVLVGTGYTDIETTMPVYSPQSNEYLVAWKANDGTQQIWAQRLAGADAAEIGTDIQVSQMTINANDAVAVAYSPQQQRFLLVWRGQTAPIATEYEIYGQLLGLDGGEIGGDFRISDMGPDGSSSFATTPPNVEWNPVQNEWLVAWTGDDDTTSVDGESEIYAQRLAPDGAQVGTNDFRVTHIGPDADGGWGPRRPRISANPLTGEYLFAFHADTVSSAFADQFEVFTQRLTGTGDLVDGPVQITDVIPNGANDEGAVRPAMVYSPQTCNFNLTFSIGDEYPNTFPTLDTAEIEVFQRSVLATSCARIPCPIGTSATVVCTPDSDGSGVRFRGTSARETFAGTALGDTMSGGRGNDTMKGNAGKDVINGDTGNDKIDGGTGNDKLKGANGKDTLRGRSGNDRLEGGRHNDKLYGYSGRDKLFGQSGNDLLSGGSQKDSLKCGAGRDRFKRGRGDRIAADCRP